MTACFPENPNAEHPGNHRHHPRPAGQRHARTGAEPGPSGPSRAEHSRHPRRERPALGRGRGAPRGRPRGQDHAETR